MTAEPLPPAAPPVARRPQRALLLRIAVAALAVAGVAAIAHALVLRNGLHALEAAAAQRLALTAARLEAALARFDVLPSLLVTSPDVIALLADPDDAARRTAVNRHLLALNSIAGADTLYLLDARGMTVAADDADEPGSPFGHDLSYRPYFREAMKLGQGRFYGVGVTSNRAGYYLAYRLEAARPRPESQAGGSSVVGVATVKVDLESAEQGWRELPGETVVLDEHRVAILSSVAEWRFHPLGALQAEERAEAAEARRYGRADLTPLDWQPGERLSEHSRRVRVAGHPYLASEQPLNQGRWLLLMMDDELPVRAAARNAALSAALATLVALLSGALWQLRRRAARQRSAAQAALQQALQAAHDSLERKVQERTAELQAAQDELVHAGKLAVIGQLSAGMVHEFNQPLAAMRTLSDNASMLIERDRLDDARGNLVRIGRLVDRLGRLTNQLKVFAYRSAATPVAVPVRAAIDESLALVAERIRDGAVDLQVEVQPPGLCVAAETVRLEQVLGNLIGNALDAMQPCALRRLAISARAEGGLGVIRVRNSGPHIDPEILARLFEPFVTSKPVGKGLGLGLMISSHLVRHYRGTMSARNLEPEGVEFTVELPRELALHEAAP